MAFDYLVLVLPLAIYVSLQLWTFKVGARRGGPPFAARGATGADRSMRRRSTFFFLVLFPGYALGWAWHAASGRRRA